MYATFLCLKTYVKTKTCMLEDLYYFFYGLHLFWFSRKIAHVHISGRQNKNKLKEKHVQSSEQLVNKVHTSL